MAEKLILGKGVEYETGYKGEMLNRNILIVGGTGSGKTYSFVEPNLLEATGSLIVSDPKGILSKRYKNYFQKEGYKVYVLDLINPEKNEYTVNFMRSICSEFDFTKLAHRLVYGDAKVRNSTADVYWTDAAEGLLATLLQVIYFISEKEDMHFGTVLELFSELDADLSNMDMLIDQIKRKYGNTLAVSHYNKIIPHGAEKTKSCIISSLATILSRYQSSEIKNFFGLKQEIDFRKFGQERSILFIKVSDLDTSNYNLANIIYEYALEVLCKYADSRSNTKLEVPVRFIFDDFASSVILNNADIFSSQIRSRNLSLMLIIQSLSQLKALYNKEAETIVGNCDTKVFLSSPNDLETANELSIRLDKGLQSILYMSLRKSYVFRRGSLPLLVDNYDLKEHPKWPLICKINEEQGAEKENVE